MSCGPMTNTLDSAFWKERVASEKKAQPLDEDGIALPREKMAVAPCPWATEDIVMGVPPAYLKAAGAATKRAGSRTSSRASSRATSTRSSRASKTSVTTEQIHSLEAQLEVEQNARQAMETEIAQLRAILQKSMKA